MARIGGLWLALLAAGCSGQYVLTVPDSVARTGGDAPAVVRVQRCEVYTAVAPVKDAPVQMRVGGGALRAAYSDEQGYAQTAVPAPKTPGRFDLDVFYSDLNGIETSARGRTYVWQADQPVVAVDLECVPLNRNSPAADALREIAGRANVVYLSRRSVLEHAELRERLAAAGLPDGPILAWRRPQWHVSSEGWLPTILVESTLCGDLIALRSMFNRFEFGICSEDDAAREYTRAGLRCLVVGPEHIGADDAPNAVHFPSWQHVRLPNL